MSILRTASRPLGELSERLRALSSETPTTASEIARLSAEFARLHLKLLKEVISDQRIDLIAAHGQTVFHSAPWSWQLFSPAAIVTELRVPVVFDLRAPDLAAGGQGAPITPLADFVLFRGDGRRCIVNLGGFCNYTMLPPAPRRPAMREAAPSESLESHGNEACEAAVSDIRGGDICVCNQLLDAVARHCFGAAYDGDGRRALSGRVIPRVRDAISGLLTRQADARRSLGTEDTLGTSLDRWLSDCVSEDLARSACAAIAGAVAARVADADRLILAGGGTRNGALVEAIPSAVSVDVSLSDEFGVPAQYREAAAIAVLGALCQDGVAITLPAVAGRGSVKAADGAWMYPPASHQDP